MCRLCSARGGRGWPCTSTAIHNTSEQQAMWVCLFDHCGRGHVMAVRHAARLHPRRHPPGFSSSERGPGEGAAGNVKDGADSWSPAKALIGGAAGPPATAASEWVGLSLTLTVFIPIPGRSWKEQREPSRRIRIRRARWPCRAACRISSSFLLVLSPGRRFSPIPPLYCRICPSSLLCV